MATFEIRLQDGRTIDIDAPDAQMAAKGAAAWAKANPPKAKRKPNPIGDFAQSYVGGLKEGVATIADLVTSAGSMGVLGRVSPANPFGMPSPTNMLGNAFSRATAKSTYRPQTTAGEYGRTLGQMTPNALAPASAAARTVNVFAPALASETAGQVARRSGASPTAEAAARGGGALVGAGAASIRARNPFRQEPPAAVVGGRARQNPDEMRARAQQYRDADIEPTLVDVVDDAGRGQIKAAASRASPGRQVANDFADARALNMPDRIGRQARRHMSRDPRNPGQIREQIGRQRSANADQAFGAVRNDPLELGDEGLATFRVPEVADAVAAAARLERDPQARTALNMLAQWAKGGANAGPPPITVGMADRVSRVLLGKARETQNPDLRATLTQFGEAIRNPARTASPGYRAALEGYAADSRLQGAVDVGEGLMRPNTDEFVSAAGRLDPRERALALAAGRRAIERRAGENVASAPGVARRLADAPEQQARNAALMGPERAGRFQDSMRLEDRAVRNARQVAPGQGSPTALNLSDESRLEGAISVGSQIARQGALSTVVSRGLDWLRSRGISDEQAEAIVRMATDPRHTDQAIAIIAQRLGEDQARQFLQLRNAMMVGGLSGPAATSASQ